VSHKLNQHFVPQMHLRLFSKGRRYIHLAARDGGRYTERASVRNQCARHKFYGHVDIETWLGRLETSHAVVYRKILALARDSSTTTLSREEDARLRQAILLQRNRTPRDARIQASASDQMTLHAYREYLISLPMTAARQARVNSIERGKATLQGSESTALMMSLSRSVRSVVAISDLSFHILRNHAPNPFIMGDSPCVFSNRYMKRLRDWDVLGLLTSGLMIVMPLDARIQVLLCDPTTYSIARSSNGFTDIFDNSDVSQLNALQVHAAEENIYFSDWKHLGYIQDFLAAHRPLLQRQQGCFRVLSPGAVLIGGVPNKNKIMQSFEPQLPVSLDLSFIETQPLPANVNPNQPRNLMVAAETERVFSDLEDSSPTPIGALVEWVESRIHISEEN
jgi:hypothetical protein